MKEIRCSFTGHFYISVEDDATPDDIENAVGLYVVAIEDEDVLVIDEYDWKEIND